MPNRSATNHRHLNTFDTFREAPQMLQFQVQFAEVREREALLHASRERDRAAVSRSRSVRHRVGDSLVRLGRRVGGDALANPAWQG